MKCKRNVLFPTAKLQIQEINTIDIFLTLVAIFQLKDTTNHNISDFEKLNPFFL